jgi:hypothetical protein
VASPPKFVVARNPDPESSLPYLLRLPVGDGIELKVRATGGAELRLGRRRVRGKSGWRRRTSRAPELRVL